MSKYGTPRYCFTPGNGATWVVLTTGGPGAVSALGVEHCATADAACADGQTSRDASDFTWFPDPNGDELGLLSANGDTLVVGDKVTEYKIDVGSPNASLGPNPAFSPGSGT
jgi:hypothetical protein